MHCPRCGSTRIRRSHTRGFLEKFCKILGYKAFRCLWEDCNWRGLVRVKAPADKPGIFLQKLKAPFIVVVMMLFSFLVFSLLLSWDFLV